MQCQEEVFFFASYSVNLSLFMELLKTVWVYMMMMNCFCGMVDRRKTLSLIWFRDHCQRSSPSRILDTPQAGFEPAQNLSSGFVEWSCAVVITTTPWRHWIFYKNIVLFFHISVIFQRRSIFFWLVNLNTRGPVLHCTCFVWIIPMQLIKQTYNFISKKTLWQEEWHGLI